MAKRVHISWGIVGVFFALTIWYCLHVSSGAQPSHGSHISGDVYLASESVQPIDDSENVDIFVPSVKVNLLLKAFTLSVISLVYVLLALYVLRAFLFYKNVSHHSLWQKKRTSL